MHYFSHVLVLRLSRLLKINWKRCRRWTIFGLQKHVVCKQWLTSNGYYSFFESACLTSKLICVLNISNTTSLCFFFFFVSSLSSSSPKEQNVERQFLNKGGGDGRLCVNTATIITPYFEILFFTHFNKLCIGPLPLACDTCQAVLELNSYLFSYSLRSPYIFSLFLKWSLKHGAKIKFN